MKFGLEIGYGLVERLFLGVDSRSHGRFVFRSVAKDSVGRNLASAIAGSGGPFARRGVILWSRFPIRRRGRRRGAW